MLIARDEAGTLQITRLRFVLDGAVRTIELVVPDQDMLDNQMSIESLGILDPRFLANPMNLHS